MNKECNKKICYNCKHHKYNNEVSTTMCNAPQNNKTYFDYNKVKGLFYTSKCPFKELEDNGEYLYWN